MLLIATQDTVLAKLWTEAFFHEFFVYEPSVTEGKNLEAIIKKNKIEVLLLDENIFLLESTHYISLFVNLKKELKIIFLVNEYNAQEELSAIILGAKAYCLKMIAIENLKKIIRKVQEGELWVDRKFINRLLNALSELTTEKHKEAVYLDSGYDSLTPREKEIAIWVAKGYPNRKIAQTLNISERTVKAHLGVIFRKLKINDRLQLALYITKYNQVSAVWISKYSG